MSNPYAPPGDADAAGSRSATEHAGPTQPSRWGGKVDALAVVVGSIALVPGILINGLLWFEHLRGIGVFDPGLGGDPFWRTRPLVLPLVVAAVGATRLALARRRWPMRPSLTKGHAVLLSLAILIAAVALIPEPSIFTK